MNKLQLLLFPVKGESILCCVQRPKLQSPLKYSNSTYLSFSYLLKAQKSDDTARKVR